MRARRSKVRHRPPLLFRAALVGAAALMAGCGGPAGPAVSEPLDPAELATLECPGQTENWTVGIDPSSGGADTPMAAVAGLPDRMSVPPGEAVPVSDTLVAYVHQGHYAGRVDLLEHDSEWYAEAATICR